MKLILTVLLFLVFEFYPVISQTNTEGDTTESKYQTDEIIVTGTRVETKIIDIPFSVQRISPSSWKVSRRQGLNDVLTTVPGLFLQSRYGGHDVRVTIRGFGSRSNTGIRGVRILLDGIPESEPDGQTRVEALDFSAIGNIELVKGNSSSLYTNAPGGVINFFTDKYFPISFVQNDNEFGSYDLRKNGLKTGMKFGSTKFMITGSYQNYEGYREHSQEYQTRINSLLETTLGSKSKLTLFAYYVEGLIKLPGSLSFEEYLEDPFQANERSVSRDEKRQTKKGRIGLSFLSQFESSKSLQHTFEITGYGTVKKLDRVARTYRIMNRSGIGGSLRYITRLKLGKRTNEFSVGGDIFHQTGPISEFGNVGGLKQPEMVAHTDEVISSAGIYFTEQFPILPDKLTLLVTGRYDRTHFEAINLLNVGVDTTRVFAKFTPKAALNFKITPNIALYTSFGYSYDAPANNELDNYNLSSDSGLHMINPDLQAQESRNIEAGIKGSFAGIKNKYFTNSFFELTFYRSMLIRTIVPFVIDNDVFFRNAAQVTRNGVEFGFTTQAVEGLTLKTSYTFQDFQYGEYDARVVDSAGNVSAADFSGNIEPSNPKHMIQADLIYTRPIVKNINAFFKSNFQHIDEMYVDDANTEELKTESYQLLSAQLGLDATISNFRLLGYFGLNNLLDKKYVAFININSDRAEFYEAGPERNLFGGLTLSYMFR